MAAGDELGDIRKLLEEIRDLLRPVADAHQEGYERRQAIRAQLSSEKRLHAWSLIDGTRTQMEIAKQAGMAQGGVSVWFKTLRELEAISDSPTPAKLVEVTP